jgi:hypothetical protein
VKQNFTTDQKKIVDLLYKNNQVGGSTHLYHAISEALKQTKKTAKNRSAPSSSLPMFMTPAETNSTP